MEMAIWLRFNGICVKEESEQTKKQPPAGKRRQKTAVYTLFVKTFSPARIKGFSSLPQIQGK